MTRNTPPGRPGARPSRAADAMQSFLWWVLRLANLGLLFLIAGVGGVLLGSYSGIAQVVPKIGDLTSVQPSSGSRIVSADGLVLASIATENRQPITLDEIPTKLQEAVLATEDREFYQHLGVDPRGIARAVYTDLRAGSRRQGGSTITQQLARNLYLTRKRTFSRKLAEMVLAVQLERAYTKSEILELYLNQIYYGEGAYGVQVASRTYFDKDVSKLDTAQCALLAGVIRAPERYSPFKDEQRATERRNMVLALMKQEKYLTSEEAAEAKAEPLRLASHRRPLARTRYLSPWFVSHVIKEFIKQYGLDYGTDVLYQGNYTIQTTLNYEMQKAADEAVRAGLLKAKGYGADQMALICVDTHTGAIRAVVGGADWSKNQYNIATQGDGRQAGSSFKPFVYTAAVLQGDEPTTRIKGGPVRGLRGGWQPHNYEGGTGGGPMNYREALAHSNNVAAVKVAQKIGIDAVIDVADKMGIPRRKMKRDLTTAIGSASVTPLEMASAFSIFATRGMRTEPYSIERVIDPFGRTVDEHKVVTWRVLDESVASTMVDMMGDVVRRGTAAGIYHRIRGKLEAAGKTGTSSKFKDAWFVGYTNDLSTAVWIGKKDYTKGMHRGAAGGTLAAPVWADFMLKAEPIAVAARDSEHPAEVEVIRAPTPHRERRPRTEPRDPVNVPEPAADQNPEDSAGQPVDVTICNESGLLAGPNCPDPVDVTYDLRAGHTPPAKMCDVHTGRPSRAAERPRTTPREGRTDDKVTLSICAITKQIATTDCPLAENKTFNLEDAPTQTCTRHGRRGGR